MPGRKPNIIPAAILVNAKQKSPALHVYGTFTGGGGGLLTTKAQKALRKAVSWQPSIMGFAVSGDAPKQ